MKDRKMDIFVLLSDEPVLWSILLMLVAFVLSLFPILTLEDGGSWTFFSLLPLWLISYFFGFRRGLLYSLAFAIPKLVATSMTEFSPYEINAPYGCILLIIILEYFAACGAFSLGALLPKNRAAQDYIRRNRALREQDRKYRESTKTRRGELEDLLSSEAAADDEIKAAASEYISLTPPQNAAVAADIDKENDKFGLIAGYLIGVFGMMVFYVVAAFIYPAEYLPASDMSIWDQLVYNVKYDGSYLLVEALCTVILLEIRPIREIIYRLKHMANNPEEKPQVHSF